MSKKNIQASFYTKEPLGNNTVQLVGWTGNHWDDISYFPKNYQIGLVQKGKGEFIVGDNVYPISAGQLFLIHPGKIHSGKPEQAEGWTVDTITIKSGLVYELFGGKQPSFLSTVVEDAHLNKVFHKAFHLLEKYESNFENEGKLYSLMTDLFKNNSTFKENEESPNNEAVQRAVEFINKSYKKSFSLDELADNAFLSKFHLLRVFKKQTGLTPYSYQTQIRLNEARKLMFKDISLTEIAHDLGFADQSHFTNTFKKHANGANPSDLLKTAISFNFEE